MENFGKTLNPTIFDGIFSISSAFQDVADHVIKDTPRRPARIVKSADDPFSKKLQGYIGEEGIKYQIPLSDVTPSELHCRRKFYHIQILLDNMADIANNELLPLTKREKLLWTSYPMMKIQLFAVPFCLSYPVAYIVCRQLQARVKILKSRAYPLMISIGIAEQWYERNFPSYDLLNEALIARTPLGDAARADWQRLQPLHMTYRQRFWYLFSRITGSLETGYEFGAVVD
mmetsp:Transcript_40180/g.63575  ORF Transcript_40180/g.63575 Transcript_40180/m.63575 type:complete len:230 (+) Transcript_40180:1323-2012(+)